MVGTHLGKSSHLYVYDARLVRGPRLKCPPVNKDLEEVRIG